MRIRSSGTALVILDLLTDFDFPNGKQILRAAAHIVPYVAALRERAHRARVPVVYVNDDPLHWKSDRQRLLSRCLREGSLGRHLVEVLMPRPSEPVIFKPKHSGFYSTSLDAYLEHRRIRRVILTGLTSHQCVLFTAMDAYVRGYDLIVPRDCIGAPKQRLTTQALHILRDSLNAELPRARGVIFTTRGNR
jgi:nicotinamidase-related amidase